MKWGSSGFFHFASTHHPFEHNLKNDYYTKKHIKDGVVPLVEGLTTGRQLELTRPEIRKQQCERERSRLDFLCLSCTK
jgi:hypothetical protein